MNPRIRTVKPELFKHEALFEAEQITQLPLRLAFIGLFACCDREGRFPWLPRRLKVDILPYETLNFAAILDALGRAGFIRQYVVQGQCYGYIPSWSFHQRINKKEPQSLLPAPYEGEEIAFEPLTPNTLTTVKYVTEQTSKTPISEPKSLEMAENSSSSVNPSDVPEVHEARAGTCQAQTGTWGKEGKGKEKEGKWNGREGNDLVARNVRPCATTTSIQQVFEYWKTVMHHPQAQCDPKRTTLIRNALKVGYSVEALCKAILGCSLTPHNQGQNDRGQRFDGLHVILRDSDQIDRFIHNAEHPPRLLNEAERRLQGNVARLEAWMGEKLGGQSTHERH